MAVPAGGIRTPRSGLRCRSRRVRSESWTRRCPPKDARSNLWYSVRGRFWCAPVAAPAGSRARCRAAAPDGRWFPRYEQCLRADDAVVVLELIRELQRPARLAFGLLGERDDGRLIRDGGELPADVARGNAANGGRSGIVDDEAALFRALGVAALRAG